MSSYLVVAYVVVLLLVLALVGLFMLMVRTTVRKEIQRMDISELQKTVAISKLQPVFATSTNFPSSEGERSQAKLGDLGAKLGNLDAKKGYFAQNGEAKLGYTASSVKHHKVTCTDANGFADILKGVLHSEATTNGDNLFHGEHHGSNHSGIVTVLEEVLEGERQASVSSECSSMGGSISLCSNKSLLSVGSGVVTSPAPRLNEEDVFVPVPRSVYNNMSKDEQLVYNLAYALYITNTTSDSSISIPSFKKRPQTVPARLAVAAYGKEVV